MISSTKVNDGLCDEECCDGSDELLSGVKCPNRCPEFALEVKRRKEEKKLRMAEGLKLKQEYIASGKDAGARRKLELIKKEAELKNVERKVIQVEGFYFLLYMINF